MTVREQRRAAITAQDDRILPLTRLVAGFIIPFLVAAFFILYFRSEETGRRFAWAIASPLTAAVMGAGYLGGAYFFLRVLLERRWHRVAGGYLPVTAFTALMLAATLLHWDTFDPGHWPFWVWLALYVLTPILVPLVWYLNRGTDSGAPEADDYLLPPVVGRVLIVAGIILLVGMVWAFLSPEVAIRLWPWPLTPLTARVVAGWQALLAVGALTLGRERRWSGWHIPFQSILLWQTLILVAAVLRRDAFGPAGPLNWFVLLTAAGIALSIGLYVIIERRRRAAHAPAH